MTTVEKWAASFWCRHLYVAKGHFKVAKTQLIRAEESSYSDNLDIALRFLHTFPHDTDLLHDTRNEALDALQEREERKILDLRENITQIEDQLELIKKVD